MDIARSTYSQELLETVDSLGLMAMSYASVNTRGLIAAPHSMPDRERLDALWNIVVQVSSLLHTMLHVYVYTVYTCKRINCVCNQQKNELSVHVNQRCVRSSMSCICVAVAAAVVRVCSVAGV
jgi:hypothetical protein